jgi:hypothetical protein
MKDEPGTIALLGLCVIGVIVLWIDIFRRFL